MKLKNLFLSLNLAGFLFSCISTGPKPVYEEGDMITLTKEVLKDKIKGGWAAQTIGVTYGGPTEFRFKGSMIQPYQPIPWYDGYLKEWYENAPGLYDDIYMDLTFVDVFDKYGLDTHTDSFAKAFANADYSLWHANQAARYNILNGIMPPESGHWINNPHADDIDFQIEADFAGLMSPCMINAATAIADKIGHIMNHGDGWYGGVYVAAMYALAFVSDDIEFIVSEALKTIPQESEFYQCINDVINWYRQYPDDWRTTWFGVEKKWSSDVGCPNGVYDAFNIDAKINSAYVVIGLLYGHGDFSKTLEISTRCGQDSDCNPATAGGILGTVIGYDAIPEYWKQGLAEVEPVNFKYTDISLLNVYEMSYNHAVQMIDKNGGEIMDDEVQIKYQEPETVKYERNFEGHYPVEKRTIPWPGRRFTGEDDFTFEFEGNGFVLLGQAFNDNEQIPDDYISQIEVYIDNELSETVKLPVRHTLRRHDITWKYQLDMGQHSVRIRLLNPRENCGLWLNSILIYTDTPYEERNKG